MVTFRTRDIEFELDLARRRVTRLFIKIALQRVTSKNFCFFEQITTVTIKKYTRLKILLRIKIFLIFQTRTFPRESRAPPCGRHGWEKKRQPRKEHEDYSIHLPYKLKLNFKRNQTGSCLS